MGWGSDGGYNTEAEEHTRCMLPTHGMQWPECMCMHTGCKGKVCSRCMKMSEAEKGVCALLHSSSCPAVAHYTQDHPTH